MFLKYKEPNGTEKYEIYIWKIDSKFEFLENLLQTNSVENYFKV